MPPFFIPNIFRDQKFCETQRFFSTKCLGTGRQNNFDGKSWYTFYQYKFSITECFWITEKFLHENLHYCQTKQFRRKIVIILLAPPPPLLPSYPLKISIPEKFWNTEGGLYDIFWHCETKQFPPESVIAPAPVILETFWYQKHFETQECSSTKCSGTGRKKSTWNCDTQLLSIKSFHNRMFLKHTRVALRNDSVLWGKTTSAKKSWYSTPLPPLVQKNFRFQKNSGSQKRSSVEYFCTKGQNSFDGKSWYAPLSIKFFHIKLFLKRKMILLRNVSVLWDKTLSTEKLPFPSYSQKFSIPKGFWNRECFLYETFRYRQTKKTRRKIVRTPQF